jgi:glyoxylase-like metal-dependent hydrolase (beta-lactamase superfamily II)
MNAKSLLASLFLVLVVSALQGAGFTQPDAKAQPDLFEWRDTCNVWVLRDGDAALLINLGDGSVLEHLLDIGVRRVEWVLFTDHHREQCQGAPKLAGISAQTAGPAAEQALFEQPMSFRKMKVRLKDQFTVHGASFVRPPMMPIKLDRAFANMDTFKWHGHEFWCVDTKGASPGGMSYLLRTGDKWLAFTGDLMLEGAKLHTWYDSEWDYGFAAGVYALANSAGQVAGYDAEWLLPSHGNAIHHPADTLAAFQEKLERFEKLLVRGYPVSTFSPFQDRMSRPTKVPHVWQVSPHIFKFRGPGVFVNFYLIIADSGHAFAVDCGLMKSEVLDAAITGMKEQLGLKQIDGVFITHMHGDHMLQAPHLREKWGAQIWALENMKDKCEHPEWFDYCAPIQAYAQEFAGGLVEQVTLDRVFHDGEKFDWEGYHFTVDWMPGQTEFAEAVQGVIDGRRIVFTGDNLFGDPRDPAQSGHEAMVARNSGILEDGYIVGAEYLSRSKPDLLLGGHSFVMPEPAEFIERYRQWAYHMRDAFKDLLAGEDYRYAFDPFWVRAQPYRNALRAGESVEITVHQRNFLPRQEARRIEIHTPPGLSVEPRVWEGRLAAQSRSEFPIKVTAEKGTAPGVRIITFDITRDGQRCGELFDAMVDVTAQ